VVQHLRVAGNAALDFLRVEHAVAAQGLDEVAATQRVFSLKGGHGDRRRVSPWDDTTGTTALASLTAEVTPDGPDEYII
jgi:hypothetical protein